jgi:YVTN family beta-propeller protein
MREIMSDQPRNAGHPAATAIDAASETVLVVRKSFNALDFIDAGSGQRLATVDVGVAPHEVAISPDGRHAAVSNYGTPDSPGTTLRIIDIERAAQIGLIDVTPYQRPHGIAWYSPTRIAATVEGPPHLLLVDPANGRVEAAIETDQEISHMVVVSPDGGRAYVANIRSGSVTVIDVPAARKMQDIATGQGSEGIALTRDGREVWVCARAANRMTVVNAQSLAVVASIAVPNMPIRVAMSPDGRFAYVTCAAASALVAIDVAARRVVGNHRVDLPLAPGAASRQFAHLGPGSPLPIGLAVSLRSRAIYLAATMSDRVQVLDPSSLDAVRTLDIGGEPDGIAISSVRLAA